MLKHRVSRGLSRSAKPDGYTSIDVVIDVESCDNGDTYRTSSRACCGVCQLCKVVFCVFCALSFQRAIKNSETLRAVATPWAERSFRSTATGSLAMSASVADRHYLGWCVDRSSNSNVNLRLRVSVCCCISCRVLSVFEESVTITIAI